MAVRAPLFCKLNAQRSTPLWSSDVDLPLCCFPHECETNRSVQRNASLVAHANRMTFPTTTTTTTTTQHQILLECLLLLLCLTSCCTGCSHHGDSNSWHSEQYFRRSSSTSSGSRSLQATNQDELRRLDDNLMPCGTKRGTVREVMAASRAEEDYFRALALNQLDENATLWERIQAYFGYGPSLSTRGSDSDDSAFNPHYWFPGGAPQTVVPVYYHVIRPSNSSKTPQSPDRDRIELQQQVLNDAFNNTVFSFELKNVSFIVNDAWYGPNDTRDGDMKKAHHVGGRNTLNVYVRADDDICGYATFPFTAPFTALIGILDGVVVNDLCIAGSNSTRRRMGLTLVHEVGHWLGLFHTVSDFPS